MARLVLNFDNKEKEGEIHFHRDKSVKMYIRFTTDAVSSILPDAENANSGWGTKNHYFFEVHNYAGRLINMQFALSGNNIPDDLRLTCDRINEFFPVKQNKKNWKWRVPFSTATADITEDMSDEEIVSIISQQYDELKIFESKLVEALKK